MQSGFICKRKRLLAVQDIIRKCFDDVLDTSDRIFVNVRINTNIRDTFDFVFTFSLFMKTAFQGKVFRTNPCVNAWHVACLHSDTNTCPRQNFHSWMAWPLKLRVDPAPAGSLGLAGPVLILLWGAPVEFQGPSWVGRAMGIILLALAGMEKKSST